MKNANIIDVHKLVYGDDMSNVMFLVKHPTFGKIKAHPVKNGQWSEGCGVVGHVMETTSGEKFIAKYEWIFQIPRKLGTPPKPKRKPQKGTKPELANAVPYDFSLITDGCKVLTACGEIFTIDYSCSKPAWAAYFLSSFNHDTGKNNHSPEYDIKKIILDAVAYDPKLIAPGVRVLCRDGKVRTVAEVTQHLGYSSVEFTGPYVSGVCLDCGMANYISNIPHQSDIMKIFVGKQQDAHPENQNKTHIVMKDSCWCFTPSVKEESKPKYEKGVWYLWDGQSEQSPVPLDTNIQIWLRCETLPSDDNEDNPALCVWKWNGEQEEFDIIAFRIV